MKKLLVLACCFFLAFPVLPADPVGQRIPFVEITEIAPALRSPPKAEAYCLAKAVYFEARNQSAAGQLGVAMVVLNRTRYWDKYESVCDTVFDGCNFSWVCGMKLARKPFDMRQINEKKAWADALQFATVVMTMYDADIIKDPTGGATYFHATYVLPYWANTKNIQHTVMLDHHWFYKDVN